MLVLPFRSPIVRTFLDYSFIFCLCGQNKKYDRWLLDNYGSICFISGGRAEVFDPLDLFPGPRIKDLIRQKVLEGKGYDLWSDRDAEEAALWEFFYSQISAGFYCLVTLDEYYIPGKGFYEQKHYIHHQLVVGIDVLARRVALAGYFITGQDDYGVVWINFDDFRRAFNFDAVMLDRNCGQEAFAITSYRYVLAYRINQKLEFSPSVGSLHAWLESYTTGSASDSDRAKHNKDLAGFNVSFGLISYRDLLLELHSMFDKRSTLNFHMFRIFSEHKKLTVDRITAAADDSIIYVSDATALRLKRVQSMALRIRASVYTWGSTGQSDSDLASKTVHSMMQCRDEESIAFDELLRQV
jgi:hypothetical protein